MEDWMSVKLTYLLSLAALLAASPALAQESSAGLSLSAPPNFSSSAEVAPPSEPASSSMSHMSAPPDASSSDDAAPPDGETSGEPSEPTGPPMASTDAIKLFVSTCGSIAGGAPDARDDAQKAGWQADDPADNGPYVTIYSGYQELAGYGSVDLWSSLESFPTQRIGYCRLDFGDVDNLLNFNDFTKLGLNGTITDNGNGNVFGSWESEDHKTLLAANRTDGQVQMEFNLLLPPASK